MKTTAQRILAVLIVALLGAQLFTTAVKNKPETLELEVERPLVIWYTDPDIQSYVEAAAAAFAARYEVETQTELVSEVDYIETVSERSVAEEMTGPDVYVASSALLEKAVLSGMASPVEDANMEETYSEKAVRSVTYDGSVVARPFYIETSFLLYNRYYAEEAPTTIDGILEYSETFEADEVKEKVEKILEWNAADVIESYMFLGAYTDLGGPCGDDKSMVSIDVSRAEECMAYYQSLNGFFAIDADTVTSEQIIRDFIDGKTVFTIANVPMLAELDRAVRAGEIPEYVTERKVQNEAGEEETVTVSFEPFYGVAQLPALTAELDTRGLSVTNAVVVNPYSANQSAAEICARYLTEGRASSLYEETGKLPACRDFPQGLTEEHEQVYEAYERAAEVPKIMELSNMWLQLEVVLADIWRGEEPGEKLLAFSELLAGQLD